MTRGDHGTAADAVLAAALDLTSAGRPAEALALSFTALRLAPARFVALAVRDLVRRLGPEALSVLHQAIGLHLDHHRTHDAVALLELSVEVEPRDAQIRIRLAELYARTGRRDVALQMEMSAVDLFERDGNNRDVIEVATHMLSLDPRHAGALRSLVRVYLRVGELDAAMGVATTLLSLDPADEGALEAVARVLVCRGNAARGLEVLRRLVFGLGPSEAALVLGRARRWCTADDYLEAIAELRRTAQDVIELTGDDLLPLTG
jgi:tetratricopeptide (TPR) repeat protein